MILTWVDNFTLLFLSILQLSWQISHSHKWLWLHLSDECMDQITVELTHFCNCRCTPVVCIGQQVGTGWQHQVPFTLTKCVNDGGGSLMCPRCHCSTWVLLDLSLYPKDINLGFLFDSRVSLFLEALRLRQCYMELWRFVINTTTCDGVDNEVPQLIATLS